MAAQRTYLAIDLKSFYASVECVDRHLDPLTTNLVVADASRTEKTICLAVSPSLKAYKIPGRARLFEAVQRVKEVNAQRLQTAIRQKKAVRGEDGKYHFASTSFDANALNADPALGLSYIVAPPRMATYIEYSTRIYQIYLKYVAPEDIHVYSIDEVFMDITDYLPASGMTAREFARKIILDVMDTTGITATAGIGTNLFLCKVAMDIVAKHLPADEYGVRIAFLDEMTFRQKLWAHQPLTDFWRIGHGYARKLAENGLFTMGDIARCSVKNEDLLYRLFGKNAELLIDHAWGFEPCTVPEIKAYKPETNSISSGQVLHCPYETDKAKLVLKEMADQLALDLVNKKIVTDQIVLTVGYDIETLSDPSRRSAYHGSIETDRYGRSIPKQAHGTQNLDDYTSSSHRIMNAAVDPFGRPIEPTLLIRRLYIVANHIIPEDTALQKKDRFTQLDLFTDYAAEEQKQKADAADLERERKLQEAMLSIRKKFGKNFCTLVKCQG